MCQHEHLVFQDGTHRLHCVDCDRDWASILPDKSLSNLDYTTKSMPPHPGREGRHDRFVLPRTTKI